MLLYADEDFDFPIVEQLRLFGHDSTPLDETPHSSVDSVTTIRPPGPSSMRPITAAAGTPRLRS